MIGPLAAFDFDRTMKLIDGFARPETRISLRLQLVANSDRIISARPVRGRSFGTFGRGNLID